MKNVSVIVPVYNAEKYIRDCVDSLINQTYKNIEIILVNDGSTDKTLEILKEYSNVSNVTVLSQKNAGAPEARNKGFEKSSGEYVIFFDADDIMDSNSIENLVNAIGDADLAIGGLEMLNRKGYISKFKDTTLIGDEVPINSYMISPIPDNKLYKSSIIREKNIKFANVKIGQDLNFYLKYLSFTRKIVFVSNTVAYYRYVSNSISHSHTFKIFDIVNSLEDVELYYKENDMEKYIDYYLSAVKIKHYSDQMNTLVYFESKKDRREIYKYFHDKIKNIYLEKCKINVSKIKVKVKLEFIFNWLLTSNLFRKIHKFKHTGGE